MNPYGQQQPPGPPQQPYGMPMGQAPMPHPPRPAKKKSKAGLVVALIAVAVIVLGGGTVVGLTALGGWGSSAQGPPPDPVLTQLPLSSAQGQPMRYGPTPVPNVCAAMPVESLVKDGWVLAARERIRESTPDSNAPVQRPEPQDNSTNGVAVCQIPLGYPGNMRIEYHAAPHASPEKIARDIEFERNYLRPHSQQNGWEVVIDEEAGKDFVASLIKGNALVKIQLLPQEKMPPTKAKETGMRVLPEIAGKLDNQLPSSRAQYPAAFGAVPDPCAVLAGEDVQTIYGKPDGGIVHREWITSPQRTEYPELGNKWISAAETGCSRSTFAPEGSYDSQPAQVDLETYENPGAAEEVLQYIISPNTRSGKMFGPGQDTGISAGDSKVYATKAAGGNEFSLLFRKGRHLVILSNGSLDPPTPEQQQQVIKQFGPLAPTIANRVQ